MKKPLLTALALCLLLCLSACGQSKLANEESTSAEPTETADVQNIETSEPDENVAEAEDTAEIPEETEAIAEITIEPVVMTESYEQGRQSYYGATGIMLPEVADATMADSSCFEETYACFDITGTYDLYTEMVAFFTDYFGSAPETGTSGGMEKSFWEIENDGGGTDCYEVYWNTKGLIYVNFWKDA